MNLKMFDKKVVRHCMKRILAKGNKIGTYDICKIYLSCFDDKRYVLGDVLIVWRMGTQGLTIKGV